MESLQNVVNGETVLFQLYKEANQEMMKASMPLQQWTSNHKGLRTHIKYDFPNGEMSSSVCILHILWNAEEDTLSIKQAEFHDVQLTKCKLLALVSTVFDPLGLIAPQIV